MSRVLLQNVTKKYDNVTAVSDFTMEIREGELLALLGPSGCGKSTVLRLIAGLEKPNSGNIYIDGRLVNSLAPSERNLALVFESPNHALYPNMTVYDNMAFGLRVGRHPPEDDPGRDDRPGMRPAPDQAGTQGPRGREARIRKRVEQVADNLGISSFLGRRRGELSAGHSQSVALGRALVRQTRILLMDDPLSQLDPQNSAVQRAELKRLHRENGNTILYVTHDQTVANILGDRIAVMDNGVLQQIGTPHNLYQHPANTFVAGFIGTPGMNLLPVEVGGPDGTLLSGDGFTVTMPLHYAERLPGNNRIVLGLWPENIKDARRVPDADPGTVVNAAVDLVENTGSDLFVHLRAGSTSTFVARMGAGTQVRPGEQLEVVFDMAEMQAFDPVSGRTLL
jgi:multiple sugar transport system ATP-binding protein